MRINQKRKFKANCGENKWTGFLFILPWLIGLICFKAGPLLMTIGLSFTKYKIISSPKFIGLQNFIDMFQDPNFWMAAKVNIEYVLITVPCKMIFALFIAYVLTSNVKGIGLFRSIYYIPSLMGGNVAIAILWRFLFLEDGLLNAILKPLGLGPYSFLTNDIASLFVVSLLHVWQFGATMVLFLAALKDVPKSFYEAAIIDGASRRKIFFSI
ncbi:MAG: sugar ABC transporter permease, partial [Candidatus Ornithospirochaeta sp.]|nr:sugar ABC transporter permease [Candidatus Ornithospirochaeta sp.]